MKAIILENTIKDQLYPIFNVLEHNDLARNGLVPDMAESFYDTLPRGFGFTVFNNVFRLKTNITNSFRRKFKKRNNEYIHIESVYENNILKEIRYKMEYSPMTIKDFLITLTSWGIILYILLNLIDMV